jgi:hypothetical protein
MSENNDLSGEYRKDVYGERSARLKVTAKEEVSGGDEGNKYKAEVWYGHKRVGDMFVKELRKQDLLTFQEARWGHMHDKYWWLRRNGFPVPKTFRYDKQNERLLVSDITENGKYTIVDTHTPLAERGIKLGNRDKVESQVRKIALGAYGEGNGVFLYHDAYTVLVDKNGMGKVCLSDFGRQSYELEKNSIVPGNYNKREEIALQEADIFIGLSLYESNGEE